MFIIIESQGNLKVAVRELLALIFRKIHSIVIKLNSFTKKALYNSMYLLL